MGQLREGVEATYRRALLLTGGFAAASIVLALGLGFVISWSFILPGPRGGGIPRPGRQGKLRRRASTCPIATSSAPSPAG